MIESGEERSAHRFLACAELDVEAAAGGLEVGERRRLRLRGAEAGAEGGEEGGLGHGGRGGSGGKRDEEAQVGGRRRPDGEFIYGAVFALPIIQMPLLALHLIIYHKRGNFLIICYFCLRDVPPCHANIESNMDPTRPPHSSPPSLPPVVAHLPPAPHEGDGERVGGVQATGAQHSP